MFFENTAYNNGSALYIINSNSFITQIEILYNSFSYNNGSSVIYLSNPGNITINNSRFLSNNSKIGTSIYYEEFYKYCFLQLYDNTFINNIAIYGGAGLFFENNFYNIIIPN